MPIKYHVAPTGFECPDGSTSKPGRVCARKFTPLNRYANTNNPPTPQPTPTPPTPTPQPTPPTPPPPTPPPPFTPGIKSNHNNYTFLANPIKPKPPVIESMTPLQYEKAKLIQMGYKWREIYDLELQRLYDEGEFSYTRPTASGLSEAVQPTAVGDIELMSGNSSNIEGARLQAAKQKAANYAYEQIQELLNEEKPSLFGGQEGVRPMAHYEVDPSTSLLETGGIVFKNTQNNKTYLTFHGKEAGVRHTESGRQMNALDDLSVKNRSPPHPSLTIRQNCILKLMHRLKQY